MTNIVGIDIGKFELEIHYVDKSFTIVNERKAFHQWVKSHGQSAQLFVFEPTGGYEATVLSYLDENALPYKSVHANHVRAFAKAKGQLAKTDKIDAKMIAHYAHCLEIKAKESVCKHPKLKALLDRRTQLVSIRREEKCRIDTALAKDKAYLADIKKHIRYLDKSINQIESQMNQCLAKADADTQELVRLYESVPGIGRIVALSLLIELPELLSSEAKSVTALVGLAPMNHDSGKMRGKRKTMGGRSRIRGLLYLATLSAIRCNSSLKMFYQRLKTKNKPGKVAIIATARKLLLILSSIAHRKTPWVNELVSS